MFGNSHSPSMIPLATAFLLVTGCAPVGAPSTDTGPTPIRPAATAEAFRSETVAEIESTPDSLKTRIDAAIENVRRRDLLTTNAFWTVFHGLLAFGEGLTLFDPDSGVRINAVDYVLGGRFDHGRIRGMRFTPTEHGLRVRMGPTFVGQGHQDQFVAVLGQLGIPVDRKVTVYGRDYAVRDFVTQVQADARLDQELSWTIIVLSQYADTADAWTNSAGEKLRFEDLVRAELSAALDQAACGGTHRLYGLTWALHAHLRKGGKLGGVWTEIDEKIREHQRLARTLQNPDGSFSTAYFRTRASDPDQKERINSCGHTFEWLSMSLSDDELRAQWMRDAANALSLMFLEIRSMPMESGALYHAAHGLVVYRHRVFEMGEEAIPAEKTTAGRRGGDLTVRIDAAGLD